MVGEGEFKNAVFACEKDGTCRQDVIHTVNGAYTRPVGTLGPVSRRADTGTMRVTRYGSSTASPTSAAALLRAVASRHNTSVSAVSSRHAAAATIAAESLMVYCRRDSLEPTSTLPVPARIALAKILTLAATGVEPEYTPSALCADLEQYEELLETVDVWLTSWFPGDPASDILTLAGYCLIDGDTGVSAVGELLLCWAADRC